MNAARYQLILTLLFWLILPSAKLHGQEKHYASFYQQLNAAGKNPNVAVDASMIYLLRRLSKDSFPDEKSWLNAVAEMNKIAEDYSGDYYAQFATEAAQKLYHNNEFQDAYYYIVKAKKSLRESLPRDKKFLWKYHETLGLLYYYFKNYPAAKKEFLEIDKYVSEVPEKDRIGQLNTLGLIAREQGKMQETSDYYRQAMDLAIKTDHLPWIAVLSGNLGEQYFKMGQLDTADILITKDYTYSLQTKQPGSAINALSLLIEISIRRNDIPTAKKRMTLLENLVKEHQGTNECRMYYRALTKFKQAVGNYKEALESYKIERKYDDTVQRLTDKENMRKTEFQVNFEKEQSEVTLLNEKKKRNELLIYGLIGLVLIVLTGGAIIFNLMNKRRKQDIEISRQKQISMEREKQRVEREMSITLANLMEKDVLIEELNAEIEHFQSDKSEPELSEEKIRLKERLQSFTLLTEDDWVSFKRLFEQLNPGFFQKIQNAVSDVTNAELRLITLMKLNQDKTEMSKVLGISPDSVRKTSLRLRKKLGMEQQEDLMKFIMNL